jgi:hypothetical protein
MAVRVASLEAEVQRLRAQHATDQDSIAEMLLSLADAEKRKAEALARATDSEHRLVATRAAMTEVLKLLEDLERREEMATGVRARTIDEARRALTSDRPAPGSGRGSRPSPRGPAADPEPVRAPPAPAAPAVSSVVDLPGGDLLADLPGEG